MIEFDEREAFAAEQRNHAWMRRRLEAVLGEELAGPKRSLRQVEPKRHFEVKPKCRYASIDGCRSYAQHDGACGRHYQIEWRARNLA